MFNKLSINNKSTVILGKSLFFASPSTIVGEEFNEGESGNENDVAKIGPTSEQ